MHISIEFEMRYRKLTGSEYLCTGAALKAMNVGARR